jgi:excisionase family DNA binding protein
MLMDETMREVTVAEIVTWWTTGQASHYLGCSTPYVLRMMAAGRLRGITTPHGALFDPASVQQFAAEREQAQRERMAVGA